MMNYKKISSLIMAVCLVFLLTGCGKTAVPDMTLVQPDVNTLAIPEQVKVVGLGEASHGVKEYQELKAEVFQTLVRDYGCQTFILECDFGNALKVDSYIHGGEGTAKDAAALTGFRIYRTKEMEQLLDWMRAYNETAPEGKDLHFYGMDMQSADNSKEYLFDILRQIDPDLCAEYEELLAFLNDTDMYDISTKAFAQGMPDVQKLIQEVDQARSDIEAAFGSEAFAFARECACSIYNCCDIRKSDKDYNQVRDGHMAEKIEWFLEHGDGSLLFLSGHNGHIGRVNASSYYDCLGKRLSETLGDQYFAIGTDAATTMFNSQGAEGFTEKIVKNENDLNALAGQMEGNRYYIDLAKAAEDDSWHSILSEKQRITTLNVGSLTFLKVFCTLKLVPEDTFDGMVIFDQVSPTTVDL